MTPIEKQQLIQENIILLEDLTNSKVVLQELLLFLFSGDPKFIANNLYPIIKRQKIVVIKKDESNNFTEITVKTTRHIANKIDSLLQSKNLQRLYAGCIQTNEQNLNL